MAKKYSDKDMTDDFKKYIQGIDYKTRLDYFVKSNLFWAFYNGDQWRGINTKGRAKITHNICKVAIDYKVANIMSRKVGINYRAENIADEPDETDVVSQEKKAFAEFMTNTVKLRWEKDKMDSLIREMLTDGGVVGDMCLYVYWDKNKETGQPEKGDYCTSITDASNVIFGNPNTPKVKGQPWIILSGRDTVKNLKAEAKANGAKIEEIESISGDNDTEYQVGEYGRIEMDTNDDDAKCSYVIKFWMVKDSVHWSKKTKFCTIVPDMDMGIKEYPVAYANWRTVKNSMHGMGELRGMIDNQIAINQMDSLIVEWMRRNAFGKTVYDRTRIANWTNDVATAIPADGDVTGIVYQLQAGNFNEAIVSFSNMLMQKTKDNMGINDTVLGNTNPDNMGAIIATTKQSAIPLENVQANLYQLVEDWAGIVAEFVQANYNQRQVPYDQDGKQVIGQYQKPEGEMMLSVSVDVGPSSYYNELVGQQALDNLFNTDKITPAQYFARVKEFNIIPDCEGLEKDAIEAEEMAKQMPQPGEVPMMPEGMPVESPQPSYEEMEAFLMSLPEDEQQKVMSLPEGEKEEALLFMMGETA